jgi:hypothetical protein
VKLEVFKMKPQKNPLTYHLRPLTLLFERSTKMKAQQNPLTYHLKPLTLLFGRNTKMKRNLLLLGMMLVASLFFTWFVPVLAQVNTEWVRRYNGSGNGMDDAYGLAADGSGNVYVTGVSYGSGSYGDYATLKYSPNGTQLWVQTYNGPANLWDYAYAIATDNSGNAYVTGASRGAGTNDDYATIKYAPNGTQQWIQRYNGSANLNDVAGAIAVDGSGNVYVTGRSGGSGTGWDYATVKYDPSGNQLWVARYNGPGNGDDMAYAIAVDGSGNVYVTGYSHGSGSDKDYATIKYSPSGTELWVQRYNGPENYFDAAYAMDLDGSGNVYVIGVSRGGNEDYATIKYSTNGTQLWVARYNGPGNSSDYGKAISVDGSANVVVTGYSYGSGTNFDLATIKYDSNGNQLWAQRYNRQGTSWETPSAMTMDGSGNIYVTGYSESQANGTDDDYVTIKYSSDGTQQWVATYNGPGNGEDDSRAIAIDRFGCVLVTGKSQGSGTDYDYATIKYCEPTVVCSDEPNDLGICDTLYVETFGSDHIYHATEGYDSVRISIYVTHDSNTFYSSPYGWVQDSIAGFVIPLKFWNQGCADSIVFPQYDDWNNTTMNPNDPRFARSMFRNLPTLYGCDTVYNRFAQMHEEGMADWDVALNIANHDSGHVFLSLIPLSAGCQRWWEGSRTLLATMTYLVYMPDSCESTTIMIDSTFWLPANHLSFVRYDATSYVPRIWFQSNEVEDDETPTIEYKDATSPNGVPDFDQEGAICGLTALANCLWYFDHHNFSGLFPHTNPQNHQEKWVEDAKTVIENLKDLQKKWGGDVAAVKKYIEGKEKNRIPGEQGRDGLEVTEYSGDEATYEFYHKEISSCQDVIPSFKAHKKGEGADKWLKEKKENPNDPDKDWHHALTAAGWDKANPPKEIVTTNGNSLPKKTNDDQVVDENDYDYTRIANPANEGGKLRIKDPNDIKAWGGNHFTDVECDYIEMVSMITICPAKKDEKVREVKGEKKPKRDEPKMIEYYYCLDNRRDTSLINEPVSVLGIAIDVPFIFDSLNVQIPLGWTAQEWFPTLTPGLNPPGTLSDPCNPTEIDTTPPKWRGVLWTTSTNPVLPGDTLCGFSFELPDIYQTADNALHTAMSSTTEDSSRILSVGSTLGPVFIRGDTNGDGVIDVSDLVYVINYLFINGPAPEPMAAGDVNCDTIVDVSDAVYLINYLFAHGPAPCEDKGNSSPSNGLELNKDKAPAQIGFSSPAISKDGIFNLPVVGKFDIDLSAVQLEIEYDPAKITLLEPALTSKTEGLSIYSSSKEGIQKIGILDLSGEHHISPGTDALVNLKIKGSDLTSLEIITAILVDKNARKIPVQIVSKMKESEEELGGEKSAIPQKFYLSQNYPNPFNPETEISYALPRDCYVKLAIYNIAGQKVNTLVDERQSAGYKTIYWNGKDDKGKIVGSGIYFYKLEAGNFTESRKMVLIK